MKKLTFKKLTARFLSQFALLIATTSTSYTVIWLYNEPEMPKSLYKKD